MASRATEAILKGLDFLAGAGVPSPITSFPVAFDRDFPHTDEVEVFIQERALRRMLDHVWQHRESQLEVMGLMIGELYHWHGHQYTIIKDIVTGKVDSTEVYVRFNEEAFQELFAQLDTLGYEYLLVGWYHSHPGHTCFLSATDINTQRTMFKLPYQTAIVIDPLNIDFRAYTHSEVGYREKSFAVFHDKVGKKIVKKHTVTQSRAVVRRKIKPMET